MKKSFFLLALSLPVGRAHAQAPSQVPAGLDAAMVNELRHNFFVLALFVLLAVVAVVILKLLLDNRLKKRLIEVGAPESTIALLLAPRERRKPGAAGLVKWIALLTAAGVGLTVGALYPPWGVHSVIILAFSLALGLTGYYFFLKRSTPE
ncbi:hypothetical protein [Hymenobacter ruricola]|uniref:Uncharacterized protein n=1 Tax=Hymenobacter ruricola TaxID=2791023 RepID=A0ABS0I359_9BACT|nr:hypothetical protein [Hymenobacter ruricola]MBF9221347.1 hypothetical protein [Hymenobacter ruricola]